MNNHLATLFPAIGERLPILPLANLPTPVSIRPLSIRSVQHRIAIKHDDLTGPLYGGNKVRKLEYLLQRARSRGARRIATFGAVGSNHAIATALYARAAGFTCTCFLSHQPMRPGLGRALRLHQQVGTDIVYFGGDRRARVATLREHLHHRGAWVIPLGGTSWLGTVGFVNAALELAEQIRAGEIPRIRRVYVAFGSMGTAAGLALGFALAGLDIEVHAVRVTDPALASEPAARRLVEKTATLLAACDPGVPADLANRTRLECRHAFFGPGYGRSDAATDAAVETAADQLDLSLESTYTGKAMAALISDLRRERIGPALFWNTCNSRTLPVDDDLPPDLGGIPREFARYVT